MAKKGNIPWNKGKKCPEIVGKNNPNWKNGEIIDKAGYVLVYSPFHPYAVQKYVRKHRLIMEKHLKRFLLPSEVVHHKNNDISDNRLKNLQLFDNQNQHAKLESIYRKRNSSGRFV